MNNQRVGIVGAVAVVVFLGLHSTARAQQEGNSTTLTIYSTAAPGAIPPAMYRPVQQQLAQYGRAYNQAIPGYAVVKLERPIELSAGRSRVRFSDVAALIDPTTVSFVSLTDPDGTDRCRRLHRNLETRGVDSVLKRSHASIWQAAR